MSQRPIQLMDVDRKLAGDPKGALLRSMLERLSKGRQNIRSALDSGVAANEYERLRAAVAAYDAGAQLLPKLWEAQHR